MPSRVLRTPWVDELGLVVVVLVVFGKSIGFPFVNWDDPVTILDNPLIRQPLSQGLRGLLVTPSLGYPQALTVVSQHLDFLIGGGKAWSFHLTNVVLHAATVLLVRRMAVSFGASRFASAACAALFAVHPVAVEPVCWATGRKDLLCAAGVLLATLAARGATLGSRCLLTVGAVMAFFSKPTGWILPAIVVVDWIANRKRPSRAAIAATAAGFVAVAALVPLAYRTHEHFGGLTVRTPAESVRFAMQHLALQLRDVVAPVKLSPYYLEYLPRPWLTAFGLAGVACVVLLAIAATAAFRRGNGAAFFGLTASLVAFLPASGLAAMHRGPADSYFYLPLSILVLALAPSLDRALGARPAIARVLVAAVVVVYGGLGFVQAEVWRSSVALAASAQELYPADPFSNEALAKALFTEGDVKDGLRYYERSVRLGTYPPESPEPVLALAFGCFQLRDPACAAKWYGEAARHYPPDFGRAVRLLSARALAPAPGYDREVSSAVRLVESTLKELRSTEPSKRASAAKILFHRYLAEDRVPAIALQQFAQREDVGEAARSLLALYH